jgi:hypothetical protein
MAWNPYGTEVGCSPGKDRPIFRRVRDLGDAITLARRLRESGEEVWLIHGDDPEPEWQDDQPGYVWVVSADEAKRLIAEGYDGYPVSDLDEEAAPPAR